MGVYQTSQTSKTSQTSQTSKTSKTNSTILPFPFSFPLPVSGAPIRARLLILSAPPSSGHALAAASAVLRPGIASRIGIVCHDNLLCRYAAGY